MLQKRPRRARKELIFDRNASLQISALLPSYPSSHLSVGEVYATLRLLAHEQQSTTNRSKASSPTPVSHDELVFVQTKPLTRHPTRPSPGAATAGRADDPGAEHNEKHVSARPLLPPPRRHASLKVSTSSRTSAQTASLSDHLNPGEKSLSARQGDGAASSVARRSGHAKSKSVGANAILPPSTPLLNPFRTARSGGPSEFLSPPPVPPKPNKTAASQKLDIAPPPLISIENEETLSNLDSNPFRRRRSVPASAEGSEKAVGKAVKPPKPPLPPRQGSIQAQGQTPSQAGFRDNVDPPTRSVRGIPDLQPTSLLKPSRLIQEGLMAAEKARSSVRSPSPNNIITLSNYTFAKQPPAPPPGGIRAYSVTDSGSDGSKQRRRQRPGAVDVPRKRERSTTLSSITTNGTTSSDTSFTTTDQHHHTSRKSDSHALRRFEHMKSSPFADPSLIDTSLPPPPKRNILSGIDGIARGPKSLDIIATSGEDAGNVSPYHHADVSRRSTLTSNRLLPHHPYADPVGDQAPSLLRDLGDDVRRAAEGVGKDLEWLRGGRGGRTLGMTLPNEEDQAGDARQGLMQTIERDNTGSTSISEDLRQNL